MIGDEAAAAAHVLLEGRLHLLGPLVAGGEFVVIADDQFVLVELRLEGAEIAALGRSGEHVHLEQPGVLQNLFQHRSGVLPIVVVLPVDDQGADRRRGRGGLGGPEEGA